MNDDLLQQDEADITSRIARMAPAELNAIIGRLRNESAIATESGAFEKVRMFLDLLAFALSLAGRGEEALLVYKEIEGISDDPLFQSLITAGHLLSLHRDDEAASLCRLVLAAEDDPINKHIALATLGRATLSRNPSEAIELLQQSRAVAEENRIPTIMWDWLLGQQVAKSGASEGFLYLDHLRNRAAAEGDTATSETIADLLARMGR